MPGTNSPSDASFCNYLVRSSAARTMASSPVRGLRRHRLIPSCRPMVAQFPIEFLPSLLGEEDPRALEANTASGPQDSSGKPVGPFHVEVDVVRTPSDQRGCVQLLQLPLDSNGMGRVERSQEALKVPCALCRPQMRLEIDVYRFIRHPLRVLVGWPQRLRRAVDILVTDHGAERARQAASSSHFEKRLESLGRPIVMCIAIGECEGSQTLRIVGSEDLRDAAAAIVTH